LIPRYTRPGMAHLWTDRFRWETILEIELLAAEALARRGALDKAAVAPG
jgi:adenylosuccinate lyase